MIICHLGKIMLAKLAINYDRPEVPLISTSVLSLHSQYKAPTCLPSCLPTKYSRTGAGSGMQYHSQLPTLNQGSGKGWLDRPRARTRGTVQKGGQIRDWKTERGAHMALLSLQDSPFLWLPNATTGSLGFIVRLSLQKLTHSIRTHFSYPIL